VKPERITVVLWNLVQNPRLTWELTPHSTQYYHSTATFFSNGTVKTVTLASPTLYEMTYGVEGEGRWNALTDTTTGHDIVTGTTFFPAANPAVVKLTGTTPDKDTYTYDTNTGNMKQFVFTVGNAPSTGSLTGTLAWNPNGSLGQYQIVDGFNAAGSETCYSNSSGSLGYGYDDLDRLIEFDCGSSWGQEYSYDQYDNLTKTILPGHTGTTWNPGYSATTNHCTGCSYDSNGDVTGDGNDVYGWNAFSKIAWTATSGTPTCGTSGSCATYDAFGRMVESSVNSTWKEYWYTQAGKMVMAGTTLSYGRWPTSFGTVETVGTTNFDYLHEDWRGNSRIVSNISNNTVVADQAYTPYGEIYNIFGANNAEYQVFAGMIADLAGSTTTPIMWDTPNRELSYVGRWLSPDPMAFGAFDPTNSQNWNRYAYVLNNPLSVIDPLGLDCIYVDNDTGEQTGFNTGDCDNSTEALANSGIYVDGTVVGGANGINNSNYGTAGPEGTLNFYVEGQEDAQSICVSDCTGAIGSSSDTFTDANSILSSLSSNLNYALGFTRSFLTFTGGPGNKPTCAGQTLRAIASETTGGFIGSQTAETSLKAASVYQAGRALKYAANRTNTLGGIGLICPQCSSIFGGMIRKAEFLGDASEALPLLDVSAAAVKSIPDVKKQAQSGTCATVVP
jgi:RHS repeat-associated protein